MLKNVAIVLADGGLVRGWHDPRVDAILQVEQESQPLEQNVLTGDNEFRGLRVHVGVFDWRKVDEGGRWIYAVHASLLPMNGISERCRVRLIPEARNTVRAKANNRPLSPCTSMPRIVRWLRIAPAMTPNASSEPNQVNRGVSSKIAAISSTTPEPMRPQGSAPTFVKMYTDSGAAVNLKNSVCNRITAAVIRKTQLTIVLA